MNQLTEEKVLNDIEQGALDATVSTEKEQRTELAKIGDEQIIIIAHLRYEQTKYPSKDPCLNYKLGYLQGFNDAREQLQDEI